MARNPKWLLPTALVAAIVIPAAAVDGAAEGGAVFALLIVAAAALAWVAYRSARARSSSLSFRRRAVSFFAVGSLAVAVAYAIVLTVISPRPGLINLLWVLGIPIVVGLVIQPRPSGLALSLPLALAGFLSLAFAQMAFHLPILAM